MACSITITSVVGNPGAGTVFVSGTISRITTNPLTSTNIAIIGIFTMTALLPTLFPLGTGFALIVAVAILLFGNSQYNANACPPTGC